MALASVAIFCRSLPVRFECGPSARDWSFFYQIELDLMTKVSCSLEIHREYSTVINRLLPYSVGTVQYSCGSGTAGVVKG